MHLLIDWPNLSTLEVKWSSKVHVHNMATGQGQAKNALTNWDLASRFPITVQNFAPLKSPLKAPLKTSITKLLLKYEKEHSKEQIFSP